MHQGKRSCTTLVVLFLLLLGATGLADSDPAKIECIPGQPYDHSLQGDESSSRAAGVPRGRVLIEIVTGTW